MIHYEHYQMRSTEETISIILFIYGLQNKSDSSK